MRFLIPGFHCQMENNKAAPSAPPQKSGALRAPPLWVFVVFHLAVETRNKKPHGNLFLFRPGPIFGPELITDFGWCWPFIKKPSLFFFPPPKTDFGCRGSYGLVFKDGHGGWGASPPPRELFGNFLGTFCKRPNTFDIYSKIDRIFSQNKGRLTS